MVFYRKPNVKTFGQTSADYISGTIGSILTDGKRLPPASSYGMDRNGKENRENILPDVVVKSSGKNTDADVAAASKWILK